MFIKNKNSAPNIPIKRFIKHENGIGTIQELNRIFTKSVFEEEKIKIINVQSIKQMPRYDIINNVIELLDLTKNTIITNGNMASVISEYKNYTSLAGSGLHQPPGVTYLIGKIDETFIYVDPYMKYSDNRVACFSDGSLIIVDETDTYVDYYIEHGEVFLFNIIDPMLELI